MTTPSLAGNSRALSLVLISTYDLGHQPFGIASPAQWLRAEGADVTCLDMAVEQLDEDTIRAADFVGFYVPMHTATRMAAAVLPRVRKLNPGAHVCVYGLYAPMNRDYLAALGADSVIGGEFETPLCDIVRSLSPSGEMRGGGLRSVTSLTRQQFMVPHREGLPPLHRYAGLRLMDGERRTCGYTEATRGCKHLCRHCPVVPVYGGRFRVVQADVVAADIAQQVAAGAQHITFGDPDFFNAPRHALTVVEELHREFPALSYDVTIKVEHLIKHARYLPTLAATGCVLVTSAVEAFDENILDIFDKRHTLSDFERAIDLLRANGIAVNPTFVAFTPWTTRDLYANFLATIHRLGLIGNVTPVQYAIRLLIPEGSLLLERPETAPFLRAFDPDGLCYRWEHPDPAMDELQSRLLALVAGATGETQDRAEIFRQIRDQTIAITSGRSRERLERLGPVGRVEAIPQLTEPWYCCAEPVSLAPSPSDQ